MSKKKVLLIGWDGADWKIINKLMDSGEMPTMAKFVEQGVMGNISTLDPPFSPMLWTTIATGVRPDKHGVLGFTEPSPDRLSVRPASSSSRKVKAIWNILTQKAYNTNVVGWWPSSPVEPINGIMISNHYHEIRTQELDKLPPHTVYPPQLTGLFSFLRVHPSELTQEHILPFVPLAGKVNQDNDKRLQSVAKIIAECTNVNTATSWIAENQDWDFLAVYYDSIDHFSHGFMNFHPPKMRGIPDDKFEIYQNVVKAGYMYHDMMLESLLKHTDENTTVIIVSDHGFHSDHLRPAVIPDEPAGPAYQHRDFGIFAMKGPNVKKDERVYGVSLLDITPTLLHLFDLPIGEDMDGVPIVQAFENPKEIKTIPTWEKVEGEAGMLPKNLQEDPFDANLALQQLVDLGYIEEPEEDMKKNVENVIKESKYNLGRVHLGAQKIEKAVVIFEELFEKEPFEGRFAFRLIECYKRLGEFQKINNIIETFVKSAESELLTKEEIKKLKEKMPTDISDEEREKIAKKKNRKIRKNKGLKRGIIQAKLVEGEMLEYNGKMKKALNKYVEVEKIASKSENVLIRIANLYLKIGNNQKAIKYFNKILEYNPDNHLAYYGIALANYNLKNYEKSVEYVLESVNLIYYNSEAHWLLGESLYNLNVVDRAVEALEVAIAISPNNSKARNKLIEIFEKDKKNSKKVEKLKNFYQEKNQEEVEEIDEFQNQAALNISRAGTNFETITVVSGLPRSGTSLLMQMLDKAGMQMFVDNVRQADDSNPKGYFEHEAVKSLARNKAWVNQAVGKVVKVVSHLLFHLPDNYHYKIIFVDRDLSQILKSQQKMLIKKGKNKKESYSITLEMSYKKNLEKVDKWAKTHYNVEILHVNFSNLINNGIVEAKKIIEFLNINAKPEDIAKAIDKKLHRTK